ncbi:unnamed protein product [Plutella xylostella]|uniref:(diamondback moth) hypothetical protein n=1 Tax=Plutella xylostella TaxID=51655 RepID=A0A8S4DJG3_PLUXY|nr:unnamed protein product [Plutella xylostella]
MYSPIQNNDNGLSDSASDLLDSHVRGNNKLPEPAMERSATSLDANSVDIGEITESPDTDYMSTSAILHYCKSKILIPYLKLLTIMGLRPVVEAAHSSRCAVYFSHLHSAQVAVFMVLGYILQYMACFRRDRGFCYKLVPLALTSSLEYESYKQVCYGNVTFTYVGPSVLHFVGFVYSLYLFRISDNEQLQNLMERVFLLSSYAPQGSPSANPKRLLRVLWCFIVLSALWMGLSLCSVNLMMAEGMIIFRWMEGCSDEWKLVLKILLIACTLIHDMVQATVTTSYCLQARLLQAHLMFLKERLLNRTITPLNWMRDKRISRKHLVSNKQGDLLIACTLIHDMVQATVTTSYCLQARLLQAHLMFLKERLLNRTITPLNWMREIAEFRKLLKYLNDDLAPAVCLFTIVNVSWAVSGALWLLDLDRVDTETEPIRGISVLNVLLWLSASAVPFIQAARLSHEGRLTQSVGHELSVRPFLHQDTAQEDITTVLMFASTLKLQAKLFHYPIVSRYLYLVLTLGTIVLFSLGMCHYLQ